MCMYMYQCHLSSMVPRFLVSFIVSSLISYLALKSILHNMLYPVIHILSFQIAVYLSLLLMHSQIYTAPHFLGHNIISLYEYPPNHSVLSTVQSRDSTVQSCDTILKSPRFAPVKHF